MYTYTYQFFSDPSLCYIKMFACTSYFVSCAITYVQLVCRYEQLQSVDILMYACMHAYKLIISLN